MRGRMGRYPWEGRWNEEGAGRKRRGRRGFLPDRQGVILEETEGKERGSRRPFWQFGCYLWEGCVRMRGWRMG